MRCTARFERQLAREGIALIAGTDEVGRGCLAGPVVAAAVILDLKKFPRGLDDSKKLTPKQREELSAEIHKRAIATSIQRVEHDEIDRINILRASLLAMRNAVKALQPSPDYVLIDGKFTVPEVDCPQRAIISGDALCVSIAAASIIAKVARDRWMVEYDAQFPGYGFASHFGYTTRMHQEALKRLGPSPIHRTSFRRVLSLQPSLFEELE